jgi:hypothetical protein
VAPGELSEVMRLTGLAADRARELTAALGGDLQMQFVWLFAGIQSLADQSLRRRHAKPQSQYGIRVHRSPGRPNLHKRASVLVTVQHAARRCAMACGYPGPSLCALAYPAQVGTRGWSPPNRTRGCHSQMRPHQMGMPATAESPEPIHAVEEVNN